MKHPNAAYDLADPQTYAKAAVEGLQLGPKYAEAIRLQHKNQLTDHVHVVEQYLNGKIHHYKVKDRRSGSVIIELDSKSAAENYADTCNRWSDVEYLEWFKMTTDARNNEMKLRQEANNE